MSASDIWPRSRISTMAVDQVRIVTPAGSSPSGNSIRMVRIRTNRRLLMSQHGDETRMAGENLIDAGHGTPFGGTWPRRARIRRAACEGERRTSDMHHGVNRSSGKRADIIGIIRSIPVPRLSRASMTSCNHTKRDRNAKASNADSVRRC